VPPELREDRGEFAAAERHELPALIEMENLRAVSHSHHRERRTLLAHRNGDAPRSSACNTSHRRPQQKLLSGARPQRQQLEAQIKEIAKLNKTYP